MHIVDCIILSITLPFLFSDFRKQKMWIFNAEQGEHLFHLKQKSGANS